MKSAHRRQRKNSTKKSGAPIFYLFIFLILGFCLWFFVLSAHFWNGSDKIAVTVKTENNDVAVVIFDPKLEEITTLIVPGDTEVNVARNLGVMRLKNVWQLGENEGVSGKLVAETVTNNFRFVSFLWTTVPNGGRSLFAPGKTNISFRDRLGMLLFSSKIGNSGRTEIDLGKNQFLQKGKLSDGENGFKISENLLGRLTIYFSDYELAEAGVRAFINDETGEFGVANEFGKILQTLGAKVVSIDKKTLSEKDCIVSGGERAYVKKIASAFSCKEDMMGDKNVITIDIGSKFAKRF